MRDRARDTRGNENDYDVTVDEGSPGWIAAKVKVFRFMEGKSQKDFEEFLIRFWNRD